MSQSADRQAPVTKPQHRAGFSGSARQSCAVSPSAERYFADPFAAADTDANCIRCDYLVEPARDERGLMPCKQCS